MNGRIRGRSITDLSLRKIHYFVTVSRLGSFTRAAAELYIAQPALSRAIAELEQRLGTQLFSRSKAGVALTSSGAYFLGKAEAILGMTESAVEELKVFHAIPSGTVRVGAAPALAAELIPRLVEECRRDYPLVRIHLRSGFNELLNRWLTNGELDLAIMEATQARHLGHFQIIDLAREQVHAIVSPQWPIAQKRQVRMAQLLDLPLILTGSPLSGIRRMVESAIDRLAPAARERTRARIVADLDTFNAAKALVLSGMGCAVYVAIAAQNEIRDGRLKAIPIQGMYVPRVIAINRSLPGTPAIQEVIQIVISLARKMQRTGEWPVAP